MKIPQTLPQFINQHALLAVVARERGVVYCAADGTLERVATVDEPHPHYSDREGFFMRRAGGIQLGSGEPYDDGHAEEDHKRLLDNVVKELREAIKRYNADTVYLFEPEHLKGQLTEVLKKKEQILVRLVAFGNFLKTKPLILIKKISTYENPPRDPSDPASVAGEKNAEEKRKILEIGKRA